nr:MAG TPA: hypothetical protein [Caudoviricetes sp.]
MKTISSQAFIIEEGSTTIPDEGVHSSEWKLRASLKDDDIVYSI